MKLTSLFVDLDGTLHDYNAAAAVARRKFADHLAVTTGLSAADVLSAYETVIAEDKDLPAQSGQAMRQERMARLGKQLEIELALEATVAVYTDALRREIAPFRGAIETLEILARSFSVVILTEGYRDIQGATAQKLGINIQNCDLYATYAHDVRKKDGSAYAAALKHYRLLAQETVMIGDNWSWDIEAASRCGMPQIWISHGEALPAPPPLFLGAAKEFEGVTALLAHARSTP